MSEPAPPDGERPGPRHRIERRGVVTSFVWGFSEATLFFFLPDIAVGAVALFGLRRGLKAAAAAVAGATLGGLALYAAARLGGDGVRDVLDHLPAIPSHFFGEVRQSIADDGGLAVVRGPWQGIPYKLYAAEWAFAGHPAWSLTLWTVPARALRIVATAIVTWIVGLGWRELFGDRRDTALLGAYAGFWVLVYAAYFRSVGF